MIKHLINFKHLIAGWVKHGYTPKLTRGTHSKSKQVWAWLGMLGQSKQKAVVSNIIFP